MNTTALKIERVLTALNRQEPDRVPVGEFFWTEFVRRAKKELRHRTVPERYDGTTEPGS